MPRVSCAARPVAVNAAPSDGAGRPAGL